MNPVLRSNFEKSLARLDESILRMSGMARHSVARALEALVASDLDIANEVIAGDAEINALRYEVEEECYELLVTEQPVARDMRRIVSALTVCSELERIGDHGKRISKVCRRMLGTPAKIPLGDIPYLTNMALAMVDRVMRAYASNDVDAAREVCSADEQVDALYKQTFNVVLSYMFEDPRSISYGTYLIQITHELERIADRATNIGERVIFSVTGELRDLNA